MKILTIDLEDNLKGYCLVNDEMKFIWNIDGTPSTSAYNEIPDKNHCWLKHADVERFLRNEIDVIEDQVFFDRFIEEIKILGWGCDFTEACSIINLVGYNLKLPAPSDLFPYPYVYTSTAERVGDEVGYLKNNCVYSYDTRDLIGSLEGDIFKDTTGTIQPWVTEDFK